MALITGGCSASVENEIKKKKQVSKVCRGELSWVQSCSDPWPQSVLDTTFTAPQDKSPVLSGKIAKCRCKKEQEQVFGYHFGHCRQIFSEDRSRNTSKEIQQLPYISKFSVQRWKTSFISIWCLPHLPSLYPLVYKASQTGRVGKYEHAVRSCSILTW